MSAHILDCPKCSKHALVERRNDLYQCLACDFKRDFTEPKKDDKQSSDFVWVLLIAFVMVLVLQGLPVRSVSSPNQPLSPTIESIPKVNELP
ncbi:hypothetical protein H6G89_11530 [Oscillatoria sp. FACHB-1407]|uniref:hypothetical protein n=1 Tax=Oscillatoria sp. FACHB-1407 TaxID=2692847 RepID=UPI00168394ED|nr:hypothetical protein [Oscillatoria sp. FACHB-1407]MBD2461682.1 hypothetical protein [Oscillatoria sp. FACHB-1407]